jgi:hypothetical protein
MKCTPLVALHYIGVGALRFALPYSETLYVISTDGKNCER